MTNKPFRVLLDLTDVHIESLKYVWINVSPENLKTIADFKTSVIHKINLEKIDIKLFVRNGLLLDDETVMILREDDTVKVQYEDQHHSGCNHAEYPIKESKKSSKKRNRCDSHSDMFLNAKKCKTDSKILTQENEEIHFDEVSKKKKKKHEQIHSVFSENPFNESPTHESVNHKAGRTCKKKDEKKIPLEIDITDFNFHQKCDSFFSFDNKDNIVEKKNNNASKMDINMESSSCLKMNSANDSFPINDFSLEQEIGLKGLLNTEITKKSGGLGNNCPKKKRKRHRKRKHVLETVVDACDNTEDFKSFATETNENIQRKHILYSSSPSKNQAVMQLDYTHKTEKVKDLTKDNFVMDKSVSNESLGASNYHPKVSTPAQSNYCENPNWHLSLMQKTNISSNCHETVGFRKRQNKTYIKSADEQNVSLESSENNEKPLDLCYTDLPSLNYRPDIGTRIAYKILELDEHYSPVISDYQVGIVKSINLDNEEMEIELLKHEIKSGRTGKFENLKEGEIPLPEVKTCDIVRWSALVEPKLFVD